MTPDEVIEFIAEEMWQVDNLRVNGKRRSVNWPEDLHPELAETHRYNARHIILSLSSKGIKLTDTPKEKE